MIDAGSSRKDGTTEDRRRADRLKPITVPSGTRNRFSSKQVRESAESIDVMGDVAGEGEKSLRSAASGSGGLSRSVLSTD